MKTRQAVLSCAGRGSRLMPFTQEVPKPLLPVSEKCLLEHNLESLRGIVEEVVLVIGFEGEKIKERFGESYKDLRLIYCVQPELLGTGHALLQAKDFLQDNFLFLNGDDLYAKEDLIRIAETPQSLLSSYTQYPSQFGVLRVDKRGNLNSIIEKPETPASDFVNVGCYHLNLEIFEVDIKKGKEGEIDFTDMLVALVEKGKQFKVLRTQDYWLPINTSEELIAAQRFFKNRKKRMGEFKPIIEAYFPEKELESIHLVEEGGNHNITYILLMNSGKKYVLQLLNDSLKAQQCEEYALYLEYLSKKGFAVPYCYRTLDGEICAEKEGKNYRLLSYIENEKTRQSSMLLYSLGKELGKLHKAFGAFDYEPRYSIPHFHDSAYYLQKLKDAFENEEEEHIRENVRKEYEFLQREIPQLYLPKLNDEQLIHGDPKFENFLFKNRQIVGIIDFDTVMLGSPYLDIGDALRSWCKKEDGEFVLEFYEEALKGYKQERDFDERLAKQALYLLSLELATRRLLDYFEEKEFNFKEQEKFNSHKEYILYKCQQMIKYYKSSKEVLG